MQNFGSFRLYSVYVNLGLQNIDLVLFCFYAFFHVCSFLFVRVCLFANSSSLCVILNSIEEY